MNHAVEEEAGNNSSGIQFRDNRLVRGERDISVKPRGPGSRPEHAGCSWHAPHRWRREVTEGGGWKWVGKVVRGRGNRQWTYSSPSTEYVVQGTGKRYLRVGLNGWELAVTALNVSIVLLSGRGSLGCWDNWKWDPSPIILWNLRRGLWREWNLTYQRSWIWVSLPAPERTFLNKVTEQEESPYSWAAFRCSHVVWQGGGSFIRKDRHELACHWALILSSKMFARKVPWWARGCLQMHVDESGLYQTWWLVPPSVISITVSQLMST